MHTFAIVGCLEKLHGVISSNSIMVLAVVDGLIEGRGIFQLQ